jgi:hypothetical protein
MPVAGLSARVFGVALQAWQTVERATAESLLVNDVGELA